MIDSAPLPEGGPKLKQRLTALLVALLFCLAPLASSLAYESTTLSHGMESEEVRQLQEALIALGYLKGTADGVFGNKTENAVRKFQKKNKLNADGLAGVKTKELIFSKAAGKSSGSSSGGNASQNNSSAQKNENASNNNSNSGSSGGTLFGGNYATLKSGNKNARVRTLQTALIALNYLSGSADGSYGKKTKAAVIAFQKANNLKADGAAGKKTLTALEKAYQNGNKASSQQQSADPSPAAEPEQTKTETGSINEKISGPASGSVELLSWYDVVKPAISNGQHLLIYDPSSGLSWTVKIIARGRHCDAEPLTAQDTRTMVQAFGGAKTWNQKGVYVQLPDGRWTMATMHNRPHLNGSVSDNGFDGHLCVHFLRDMDECRQYDPDYGVTNQTTLREAWKALTGITVN